MIRKCVNIICLAFLPFVFIWSNFYLTNIKGFSSKFTNILEGIVIGVFLIATILLTQRLIKQFKYGYYISILCVIAYLFWYILIIILATQTYVRFSSPVFTLAMPLPDNIDIIIAATLITLFQKLKFTD